MKKRLVVFLVILNIILGIYPVAFAKNSKPSLKSSSALLADITTGKYLYTKNADEKIQPGGFVKIMTAIVAIENMVDKNETVIAH